MGYQTGMEECRGMKRPCLAATLTHFDTAAAAAAHSIFLFVSAQRDVLVFCVAVGFCASRKLESASFDSNYKIACKIQFIYPLHISLDHALVGVATRIGYFLRP
jgi:hypothetical protein